MNALNTFYEFEAYALRAYERLKADDPEGYRHYMRKAERVAAAAESNLAPREARAFGRATARTYEVLRKLTALGLINIEKRLREFRIADGLALTQLTLPMEALAA